jgi:predicted CoA-binding protein
MEAKLEGAVRDFLACPRIGVAGVSRDHNQTANAIFRKLKETGHTVFATNPRAEQVEGGPCYPNLASIPGGVEAVVIVTPAAAAVQVVQECRDLGIQRVWLHRSLGRGSVSGEAVRLGRDSGLTVIDGACPMMFCAPVDPAHRCLRVVLGWFGRLPRMDESTTRPAL